MKAAIIRAVKDRTSLLLLLLLLFLPHAACGMPKVKCPLNLKWKEEMLSYYRPGDYVIGWVKSTLSVASQRQDFDKPPCVRIET